MSRFLLTSENRLMQARRDLRDVQQQLDELSPGPFPLGSHASRRFCYLRGQASNLQRTIGQLVSPQQLAA